MVYITVADEGIGRSALACQNFEWNLGDPFPAGADNHKVVYFKFSGTALRWIKRMIFLMAAEKTLVPAPEGPGVTKRKALEPKPKSPTLPEEEEDDWMEG